MTPTAVPPEGCPVTVYEPDPRNPYRGRPCGLPDDGRGLCAKHAADRDRLVRK